MLPTERRERIRAIVRERRHVKVSDLSRELKVSEMTIYRDLKPLLKEGEIEKTHGGITWAAESEPAGSSDGCVLCNRPTDPRLVYRLALPDQRIESACCPHCGLLRHRQVGIEGVQAMCQDFFTNTTISATRAWYVLDTEVDLRCCQPQALAFERRDHAEKFVKGFGGQVLPFAEAMDALQLGMQQGCGCGCSKSGGDQT
ncbi:NosL protein [Melghirimyces profundicolus]|uniref:NosL protein n=1 Tax=Melghirimyces profundicolus TaxID=1242148 RepID=A0A2T6BV75_9BACL|nr:DeoR family transcriptional regulator [Melghirimyces profundicolus]PTX59974.1 NosL protein [Melghirimyces profundicolus]